MPKAVFKALWHNAKNGSEHSSLSEVFEYAHISKVKDSRRFEYDRILRPASFHKRFQAQYRHHTLRANPHLPKLTHLYNTFSPTKPTILEKEIRRAEMYKSMTTNLMVESVDKSIVFYRDVLGFSVVTSVPGKGNELQFAIMSNDDILLMLQEKDNLIE